MLVERGGMLVERGGMLLERDEKLEKEVGCW
jgi:hypothetical protein